jgi:hypothetical protein
MKLLNFQLSNNGGFDEQGGGLVFFASSPDFDPSVRSSMTEMTVHPFSTYQVWHWTFAAVDTLVNHYTGKSNRQQHLCKREWIQGLVPLHQTERNIW